MEFWHGALLAGTATFAIPVVIHLMFRMRKRRIVFSSLRFLQQSVMKQSQRLRLREIILLLLRCAWRRMRRVRTRVCRLRWMLRATGRRLLLVLGSGRSASWWRGSGL